MPRNRELLTSYTELRLSYLIDWWMMILKIAEKYSLQAQLASLEVFNFTWVLFSFYYTKSASRLCL